jgi:hypothetical protein
MKVNVISILWGKKYDKDDVNRLYSMIKRNTSLSIDFILFSNNDLPGLNKEISKLPEPAIMTDIYSETLNYRKEAGLCDNNLGGLNGQRVFFFDLDVLITGDLDELFCYPKDDLFYIINDWNTKGNHVGQATCYSFVVGKLGFVKDFFEANSNEVISEFGTASQEYLSREVQKVYGELNFWPEKWFNSFKIHCLPVWFMRRFSVPNPPPSGTKVLAFHGHPDLNDALNGTWHDKKKHRWKIWKKLYKCCKPTLWIADYWN